MQHSVNILDRLWRKLLLVEKIVIHGLYHVRSEARQPNFPDVRFQMNANVLLIGAAGRGLRVSRVLDQPNIQPCTDFHNRRLNIGAFIDFHRDLRKLLPDLFLGLSVHGFLTLLSGFRVSTNRVSPLPASVGTFADGAGTFRAFGRFIVCQGYLAFLRIESAPVNPDPALIIPL